MSTLNDQYHSVPKKATYVNKKRGCSPSGERVWNINGREISDSRPYATHWRDETDWRHPANWDRNSNRQLNNSRRFDNEQHPHYQRCERGWDYNRRTDKLDVQRTSYYRSVVDHNRFTESDSGRSRRYHEANDNQLQRNRRWERNRRDDTRSAWNSINDYDDTGARRHRVNVERDVHHRSLDDGQRRNNNHDLLRPRSDLQRDHLSSWGNETDCNNTEVSTSSRTGAAVPRGRQYENGDIRMPSHNKRKYEDNHERSRSQQSWDSRRTGESFEFDNRRRVTDKKYADQYLDRSALQHSRQQVGDMDTGYGEGRDILGYDEERSRTRIQDHNSISDHNSRRADVELFRTSLTRENLMSRNEKSVQEIKETFTEDSEEDGEIDENAILRNRGISTVGVNNVDHKTSHLASNDVNVVPETSETSSSLLTQVCAAVIASCTCNGTCEDSSIVPPIVTSPDHPDSGSLMATNHSCVYSNSSFTADSCEKLNQSSYTPFPCVVEIQQLSGSSFDNDNWEKVIDSSVTRNTTNEVASNSSVEIVSTGKLLNNSWSCKIVTESTISTGVDGIKSAIQSRENATAQSTYSVGNIPKKKRKVVLEDIMLQTDCIIDQIHSQNVPKSDDICQEHKVARIMSKNKVDDCNSINGCGNSNQPTIVQNSFLYKEKKKKLRKLKDTIAQRLEEQPSSSAPKRKLSPKPNCIDDDLMDSESDCEMETSLRSKRKIKSDLFDEGDRKLYGSHEQGDRKLNGNNEGAHKKTATIDMNNGMKVNESEGKPMTQNDSIVNNNATRESNTEKPKPRKMSLPDCTDLSLVTIGARVAVYWDGEDDYFEGIVTKIKPGKKRGFRVKYDDGDKDWVNLKVERFRLLGCSNSKDSSSVIENNHAKLENAELLYTDEKEKPLESTDANRKSWNNLTSYLVKTATPVEVLLTKTSQSTESSNVKAAQFSKQQTKQPIKSMKNSVSQASRSMENFGSWSGKSQNYLDRFKYQNNVERLKLAAKNNAKICSTLNKGKIDDLETSKGDLSKIPSSLKPTKVVTTKQGSTFVNSGKYIPKKPPLSTDGSKREKTTKVNDRSIKSGVTTQQKDTAKSNLKKQSKSGTEHSWVKAGLRNDSSDSETDDEEVMQWASKMFGVPVSPSTSEKGTNLPITDHCLIQSKFHPRKLCDESEEVIRRRKEEARPLTAAEIRAILKDDCDAENSLHWVRRSSRQPSKSALSSPKLKSLIEKLKSNDKDMVVLKMKKYCSDSATPTLVINTVLDALEENTNCEALYIQNYNLGMRDEQVLHLLRILQRPSCKIWCLNIGETYNVQTETWEIFAEGLKDTNVTHMYASEHTITTELKDQIRNTIRNNRSKHSMHIDPNNVDTIVRCTHCWWNPFNAAVLRPYIKKKGYDSIFMDAEAQGLPGTMSEAKYLI